MRAVTTFLATLALVALMQFSATAQNTIPQPQLLSVFPAGAKAGTSMELQIIEEVDLAVATGLIFSHPGINAEPITPDADRFYPEPKPLRDRFKVAVDASVPPGVYEVRAKCRYGVSNSRRFVVSGQAEITEQEPNNELSEANEMEVGSTMNATFSSDFDTYKLKAKQGQKLVIDCLAQRIDSRGDPVLTLLDSHGKTLQRSQDTVGTDATIVISVDRDQELFVRVNDLTFMADGGAGLAAYRLSVREGPWIDYVDPPFAVSGKSNRLTVYGRNLDGVSVENPEHELLLEKIEVKFTPPQATDVDKSALTRLVIEPFQIVGSLHPFRHSTDGRESNPFPVTIVTDEMTIEVEPNNSVESAQAIAVNELILGTFDGNGSADRYRFTAKKNEHFQIQIESHQLNGSTDPLLAVQTVDQQQDGSFKSRDLKVVDDQSNDNNTWRFPWSTYDPSLEFVAPQDGDYYILVQNQYGAGRGFPDYYRLAFNRSESGFRLNATAGLMVGQNNNRNIPIYPNACIVRRGGGAEILLIAHRSGGFEEEIHIHAEHLPPGITASTTVIGPGETFASLMLSAADDAKPWSGPIRLFGSAKSVDGVKEITQVATPVEIMCPTMNNNNLSQATARFGESIFVSVVEGTPVVGRIETPDQVLRMARGGRLQLPLKFAKTGEFTGNINAFACGLPSQVSRGNASLPAGDDEVKMNIDVQQNCKPGSYSFFVRADLDTNFRRYPALIEEARADQSRINQLFNDSNQAYQRSIQTRSRAEQQQRNASSQQSSAENVLRLRKREFDKVVPVLKEVTLELQTAIDKQRTADQELESAQTALIGAGDEPAKKLAQEAVASKQQLSQIAEATMNSAKTRHKQIATQHTSAIKQLDEATRQMRMAEEALEKATTEIEKARTEEASGKDDRDLAQRKKSEADRWVQRANQITQQRRVKSFVYSPGITIDVVPFPIEFKLAKEGYEVIPGGKLNIKVSAVREFDANDEIRFQLLPPTGVSGWSLGPNQSVKRNEQTVEMELNVHENTEPGEYIAKLRGGYRFNNRFINQELAVPVLVAPKHDK